MPDPQKDFDCVEMKHRIQEEIARETEGMTPEQWLAHIRKGAEEFERRTGWRPAAPPPQAAEARRTA